MGPKHKQLTTEDEENELCEVNVSIYSFIEQALGQFFLIA